jgi:hypothetical protein
MKKIKWISGALFATLMACTIALFGLAEADASQQNGATVEVTAPAPEPHGYSDMLPATPLE